ncbi:flagellar basal body-associated FliL family protein [Oceanobacillus sp. FSL H7-0719]|uniref:flagellar basal body-associated FliL family protein n=1 Tax=Oceanobacillus sp. FSL H7-0719 TaxID=2954507 RepID=UPI003254F48B
MSKLVKVMVTSFAILLIASIATIVVLLNVVKADDNKELTIEEVVKYSYQTPEITTDLEDGTYVRIQFQVITDGKDAHEEVSQRDFQLVNILIKELAVMNEEDFKSGLSELEQVIKTKLNEVMTEGQITDVLTINKILQ